MVSYHYIFLKFTVDIFLMYIFWIQFLLKELSPILGENKSSLDDSSA
jgi:hypothetical protein